MQQDSLECMSFILVRTWFVQEVSSQVFATLYDYPSLKTCSGLVTYIRECVTLSWALSVQTPPVVIDYDARVFQVRAFACRLCFSLVHRRRVLQTCLV